MSWRRMDVGVYDTIEEAEEVIKEGLADGSMHLKPHPEIYELSPPPRVADGCASRRCGAHRGCNPDQRAHPHDLPTAASSRGARRGTPPGDTRLGPCCAP